MRSACNPALSAQEGQAEYIPSVLRSGFRNLAALRGVVRASPQTAENAQNQRLSRLVK
jgi:hypothetical protein